MTDINIIANEMFDGLLDDILAEEIISLHWLIKTGNLNNNISNNNNSNNNHKTSTKNPEKTRGYHNSAVNCPVCKHVVGGQRFAIHLENCIKNNKKLTNKRNKDSNNQKKMYIWPEINEKSTQRDLYPRSTVIRIRLSKKNGLPLKKQARLGASIQEFNKLKEEENIIDITT